MSTVCTPSSPPAPALSSSHNLMNSFSVAQMCLELTFGIA